LGLSLPDAGTNITAYNQAVNDFGAQILENALYNDYGFDLHGYSYLVEGNSANYTQAVGHLNAILGAYGIGAIQ